MGSEPTTPRKLSSDIDGVDAEILRIAEGAMPAAPNAKGQQNFVRANYITPKKGAASNSNKQTAEAKASPKSLKVAKAAKVAKATAKAAKAKKAKAKAADKATKPADVPNPLANMSPRYVFSRAYHQAKRDGAKAGLNKEACAMSARKAGAEAREALANS
jgi:hypothetical protein